jgi:phosphohistidine phosphatase
MKTGPARGQIPDSADMAHRTLLLLRHAKSAWPDVPDQDRPLAARGRRDAPVMGHWLRAVGYLPDRVVCSTALRASQTWRLAQPALGDGQETIFDDRVYDASPAQLLEVVRGTPARVRTLLVVGHDPALPELARSLAAAAPDAGSRPPGAADPAAPGRMRGKFPTAAIAAFGYAGDWQLFGPGRAQLACFVTPRELQARSGPSSGAERRSGIVENGGGARH